MTINITDKSPIQYYQSNPDPNICYLNKSTFDSRFFFTSDEAILYYTLFRVESDGETKVISYDKLVGHSNGIDYDYRFDFDRYIQINNQIISKIKSIDGTIMSGTPLEVKPINHFYGSNVCKIYFCVSSSELVSYCLNNGSLIKKVNGEIIIPFGGDINLLPTIYYYFHFKYQRVSNPMYNFSSIEPINGTIYPITIYGNPNIKIVMNTNSDVTQYIIPKQLINEKDFNVYLLYIPKNCINIQIYELINYTFVLKNTIETKYDCYNVNDYYFINEDSILETIRCTGNVKHNDTITKENLQIGNKLVQTKININKYIIQNTGFGLNQEQLYGLIKAPVIYSIDGTNVKEYSIETNSFDGYNGKKLSEKNIELKFIDSKQYQRKTNYTVGYFD